MSTENVFNEEMENIITLNDENGDEVKYEFIDVIEYNGNEYIVLLPLEDADDSDEVIILKIQDTDDEDIEEYVSVENEETLMAVFEIFKEKFKDEFNFLD